MVVTVNSVSGEEVVVVTAEILMGIIVIHYYLSQANLIKKYV